MDPNGPRTRLSTIVHHTLVGLILINITTCVLGTVPELAESFGGVFEWIETISLVIFATEYVVRVWCAPEEAVRQKRAWAARLRWMTSGEGIIDLLAIAPFVVTEFTDIDLRVAVLIRLLRFFKIARYSTGFHSLAEAVKAERNALFACLMILGSVILVMSGLLYVLEHKAQPDKFGTIPDAMWWAIATVTTVGYGDVVPITVGGRILGGVTMIVGLLLLALPAGIVTSAFSTIIAQRNFVVTAGLLARMPLFSGVDASAIISLLPAVGTRTYGPGEFIVRRGEPVTSLFLIAEGKVEVERGRYQRRLGSGDCFAGEPGKVARKTARAESVVKILVLAPLEVDWLLETFPQVATRIVELL